MTGLRTTEVAIRDQVFWRIVITRASATRVSVLRFASFRDVRRDVSVCRIVCCGLARFEVFADFLVFALDGFVVACASSAVGCHVFVFCLSVDSCFVIAGGYDLDAGDLMQNNMGLAG
jgi:hypothetical protein